MVWRVINGSGPGSVARLQCLGGRPAAVLAVTSRVACASRRSHFAAQRPSANVTLVAFTIGVVRSASGP
jgi:hypothetical protein